MLHARDDYQRIQDPAGKIPEDEPVFLVRAQDRTAPNTVQYWAGLNEAVSPELAARAYQQVRRMLEWQQTHGCKAADL